MPSPRQVSGFPSSEQIKNNATTVSTLVGGDNKELVAYIITLAKSEDDPPIVFGWDMRGLEEFWNKAVAYGASAAPVTNPPNEINNGIHLAGPATGANIRDLQIWILNFFRAQLHPNAPSVFGGTAGLACSLNQFGLVIGRLSLFKDEPWVAAVLAHGGALANPLGTLWHPRPRVTSGICDQITGAAPLWE